MGERLKGQTAIITGASAGIGWAAAHALAAEGCNLVVTARRVERLEKLVTELEAGGARAVFFAGDAAEEATATEVVQHALKSFGRIDILLNNAGAGNYKQLVETTAQDFDEMLASNVRSSFLFSRAVVPHFIAQKSGKLMFVSSVAGIYGYPGEAVYCATKFAQIGMAQALDKELRGHGIQVSALCPGGVKTEFAIGKGRTVEGVAASGMMEPEEVAEAILLACLQRPGTRISQIMMRPLTEPWG
jgi:3-oxoacyl-[acyl-carrier protein] reductase